MEVLHQGPANHDALGPRDGKGDPLPERGKVLEAAADGRWGVLVIATGGSGSEEGSGDVGRGKVARRQGGQVPTSWVPVCIFPVAMMTNVTTKSCGIR